MGTESTQHKLDRVRSPRVQITYDLETGGATEKVELPFVVALLADLAGKSAAEQAPMKERKLTEIDRDNFGDVMSSIGPSLEMAVSNELTDEDSKLKVDLKFNDMADFEPHSVVQQVDALRSLHDARSQLADLMVKLDGNDELARLLGEVVSDEGKRDEVIAALGPAEES